MDFKKAFDRVWLAGLWQVLRSFNVEKGLVQAIQVSYENSSSVVLLSSQLGEFFETTVGVRQLAHPVQLVPREDHAAKYFMTPHINFHWWKVHIQPTICRQHRCYGRQK